jgi:hypothetical protein
MTSIATALFVENKFHNTEKSKASVVNGNSTNTRVKSEEMIRVAMVTPNSSNPTPKRRGVIFRPERVRGSWCIPIIS